MGVLVCATGFAAACQLCALGILTEVRHGIAQQQGLMIVRQSTKKTGGRDCPTPPQPRGGTPSRAVKRIYAVCVCYCTTVAVDEESSRGGRGEIAICAVAGTGGRAFAGNGIHLGGVSR